MDELGSIRLNQVTVSVEITTGMQMTLMNQIILLILRDQSRILADQQQLQFFTFMLGDKGVRILSIEY